MYNRRLSKSHANALVKPIHQKYTFLKVSSVPQAITIPEWISANYLLKSLNDNAIRQCLENIIELMTIKGVISMLIKASTTDEFKDIHDILQSSFDQQENSRKRDKNTNYFDVLPSSTIYNVCDFLDRTDMIELKKCSMRLSLIVFEFMKCIAIGIVNMNEIILNNAYKYSQRIQIFNKIKVKRIKPFTKLRILWN